MTHTTDLNSHLAVNLFGWQHKVVRIELSGKEHMGWESPEGGFSQALNVNWSDSWQGAGQVIEAMKNRGYFVVITWREGGGCYVSFMDGCRANDPIPCKAIARAAVIALEAR